MGTTQPEPNETNEAAETNEDAFHVFDVPLTATAAEMSQCLNDECMGGLLYVNAALPWPGVGIRVVMRRYARPPNKSPKAPEEFATREAKAIQFLRENRELPNVQIAAAFKALHFPRSTDWIAKKRIAIIRAERGVRD